MSATTTTSDPNSVANIGDVRAKHYHIVCEVDMAQHVIRGSVQITFEVVASGSGAVERVQLDVRDVKVGRVSTAAGQTLHFDVTSPMPALGQCVDVQLGEAVARSAGATLALTLDFETSPSASGLQWLPPAQTEGKQHPYLFSQFQAIHCRSFIPCQDTPAVKATYSAEVTVARELTALMSAIQEPERTVHAAATSTFFFAQKVPIPSYLIAIVVGCLASRDVGPRTKVWSEPSVVEAAAHEFADTEDYLRTAEQLLTPYEWGRYDLLVLPGSFPYGGMENPCLTFVTPTLLAGDRSLTSVVAHEIAHSWMGNLVTNRSWEHFWLNEGFTVFVERKILGRLHGEKLRQFCAIGGWGDLKDSVELFGADHPFTALNVQLHGLDPDDAFSSVPYEKGFALLYYLETLVGVERFEAFLRQWVQNNAFGTVSSDEFRAFFESHFADCADSWRPHVDWHAWLVQPGMPPVPLLERYDDELVRNCRQLADRWGRSPDAADYAAADLHGFSSGQTVLFLELLYDQYKPSPDTLAKMDALYAFTQSKNSEILFRWFKQAIASEYKAAYPALINFVTSQGRMKYVRPLYRDLFNTGRDEEKQLALNTFAKHRTFYNNIAAKMLARDLKLDDA